MNRNWKKNIGLVSALGIMVLFLMIGLQPLAAQEKGEYPGESPDGTGARRGQPGKSCRRRQAHRQCRGRCLKPVYLAWFCPQPQQRRFAALRNEWGIRVFP